MTIPAPGALPPLRVLIADDSRIVHRYLALTLAMVPGAVLAGRAFNVREAIDKVGAVHPDFLILDLEMPDGSGLDVLKALDGQPERPVVCVLTLHASPLLERRCLELGADYFFDKENDLPVLLETIADQTLRPRLC